MASGGPDEGHQINISYKLAGRDPKEIERIVQETLKELGMEGSLDPDLIKILPQETEDDWELELTTGKEGCACPVVVHVCGVKGDAKPITLQRDVNGNAGFIPGKTNKFLISVSDSIGDVFKLRFGFPDNVPEATWSLTSVKLFHPVDKDTFKDDKIDILVKKTAALDPWQEMPIIWPDYPRLPIVNYQVYLGTAVKSGRMDSNAYITLYGDYGNTGKRQLKKSLNTKIKFQPGQNDRFEISALKLGEVRKVWIQNECNGSHKSWMLEKVVVKESVDSEREWNFRCHRYFDPQKGDRKTDRFLELGKLPEPEPGEEDQVRAPPPPPPKVELPPEPPPPPLKPPSPPPPPPPPPQPEPEPEKSEPPPVQEETPNNSWTLSWANRDEQMAYEQVDVLLTIVGEKGESSEFLLQAVTLSKGELGTHFPFEMEPVEVGDLSKVRIRFGDDVKVGTRWDLQKMLICHLASGSLHTFFFNKPIIKQVADTTAEASSENIPSRTYICTLFTGSRQGLTGEVHAYLVLLGEKGDSGKRWIVNPEEGKQGLQPGETMKMEIDSVDLGQITGVQLGHDLPDKDQSYFLEKVTVRPSHRADLQYTFLFEEDGETKPVQEKPKDQTYDVMDWQMSWTNNDNQPHDFLTAAAVMHGQNGKKSTSNFVDVELRPGESEGYLIRVDQDLGDLIKVGMTNGPNVKGKHPWLASEMRFKNLFTTKIYTFKLGGGGDSGIRKYRIEIYYTVKGMAALGNTQLNIKLLGEKLETDRLPLDRTNFQNSQNPVEMFDLDLPDLGDVKNIRLGHNKKNKAIGFFVSKVVVKIKNQKDKEWSFNIPYQDDEESVANSEWLISWVSSESQAQIMTTVVFVFYGENGGKTPEISAQTMLRPGQSEEVMYLMEKPLQFKVYKVRVGFWDKQYDPINWNLKVVRVRCMKTRTLYTFTLNGIVLFNEERDGWREIAIDVPPDQRRLPTCTYEVQIFTSKDAGVVTDAKVYIQLNGKMGDTGKRKLLRSLNNGFKNFIPGRMDTFRIEAVDLDEIQSIVLGHNDQGRYPSWHCERVIVTERQGGHVYEFDVDKWFDKKRADRLIEREFPVSRFQRAGLGRKWFIKLKTGDHPRAATKTSIALYLCGKENTSDVILLGKTTGVEGFKPKEVYEFNVEVDLDDIDDVIGELFKIRLGFLDWNQWPAILIKEVYLEELATGANYYVDVNEWIWASPKRDGWREFQVRGPAQTMNVFKYQLAVWTGYERNAGIQSSVNVMITGTKGDSGKRRLCMSKSHITPFQPGQMDMFDIEAVDLGDIKKVMLSIIPEEAKSERWHAVKVTLQLHPFNGEEFEFDCNRWFDAQAHTSVLTPSVRNEGRIYISQPGEHLVYVTTGKDPPPTSSNISLFIYGEKGKGGPFPLERPPVIGPNGMPLPVNPRDRPFQLGAMDYFQFLISEEQIGRILKVRLVSDSKGKSPNWLLEKMTLQNLAKPRSATLHFNVNDWFSEDRGDGELVHEFPAEHPAETPLETIRYKVEVNVGSKNSPLIPHNVDCYVTLSGNTKFTSGPRPLKKNTDGYRLLQPNTTNVFYMTAVGVGEITKLVVGHTCPDPRFKFHVTGVTVSWDPNNRRTFPCDSVIIRSKPNIPAEITLLLK